MKFEQVYNELQRLQFNEYRLFSGKEVKHAERLQTEFNQIFPRELIEFISWALPPQDFSLEQFGTYFTLFGRNQLSFRVEGYNWDPTRNEPIKGWNSNWLLIGEAESDPIIVDLTSFNAESQHCEVFQAMHGAGEWDFYQIADSVPQFLLCAIYVDYACTQFDVPEVIIRQKRFLRPSISILESSIAKWLFPRLKEHAGEYYDDWVSFLNNA